MDMVYDVDTNDEDVFCKTLVPETPEPPNKNAFSLAKIRKSPVYVREVLTVLRTQGEVLNSLYLVTEFVRASSRSKPFGASVTGS